MAVSASVPAAGGNGNGKASWKLDASLDEVIEAEQSKEWGSSLAGGAGKARGRGGYSNGWSKNSEDWDAGGWRNGGSSRGGSWSSSSKRSWGDSGWQAEARGDSWSSGGSWGGSSHGSNWQAGTSGGWAGARAGASWCSAADEEGGAAGRSSWGMRKHRSEGEEGANVPPQRQWKRIRVSNIPSSLPVRDICGAFEAAVGKISHSESERDVAYFTFLNPGDAAKAADIFDRGELNGNTIEVQVLP